MARDAKQMGRYFALAQVGMEMVMPVVAGGLVDYYMQWGPWGMIAGAVFGFLAGIIHLVMLSSRNGDADNKPPENTP
jgi:F0F1-type ATP synthase assembly protein I